MLQAGRPRVLCPIILLNSSIDLILAMGSTQRLPGDNGQLTISPPSVKLLSKECGSLDVSQRYGPPQPVTAIVLLLIMMT
jgi:hypothetical protein